MGYYERGRDESLKIGNTVNAAVANINIAQILSDRGEVTEAEALLLDTLPLWKSSQYRYFLGASLLELGRTLLRAGRVEQAIKRLEEAKANFLHVGAEQEILEIEARLAECRVRECDHDGALALADAMLRRGVTSKGIAKLMPLLQRVRAHALMQKRDWVGARKALQASLAAGRSRRDLFEVTFALLSLIELDRLEGVDPQPKLIEESRLLVESLKIKTVPSVPLC